MKWHHLRDFNEYVAVGDIARITPKDGVFAIRVKNRSGGWNYATANSLASAKRKAKKMIEEEGK